MKNCFLYNKYAVFNYYKYYNYFQFSFLDLWIYTKIHTAKEVSVINQKHFIIIMLLKMCTIIKVGILSKADFFIAFSQYIYKRSLASQKWKIYSLEFLLWITFPFLEFISELV